VLHPLQLARAAESGAAAVVLIACVLGARLEELLDFCTTLGIEAVVEVHTPAEAEFAVAIGATIISVNNWDRTTNELHLKQAIGLRSLIPENIVTIATGALVTKEQLAAMHHAGFDAVILGRAIVQEGGAELARFARAHEVSRIPSGMGMPQEEYQDGDFSY